MLILVMMKSFPFLHHLSVHVQSEMAVGANGGPGVSALRTATGAMNRQMEQC